MFKILEKTTAYMYSTTMSQIELFADGLTPAPPPPPADDTDLVDKEAARALTEIHRIMGFLRFAPDEQGIYTARCEPDYFILPALAEHFTLRFGDTPWAIIDEKRGICLSRKNGNEAELSPVTEGGSTDANGEISDRWAELWRLYHRSISIETRKNPRLQQQLIPNRYRKHLNEL